MEHSQHQIGLFDGLHATVAPRAKVDLSSTFAANNKLPVHRWFRFSAGFSAAWAEKTIRDRGASRVLDPFAGSGTTLLAAEDAGATALGVEAHPFIYRIAAAKLLRSSDSSDFEILARRIRFLAETRKRSINGYPPLILKCYPLDVLRDLDALRRSLIDLREQSPAWHLCWMALACILRICSPVGTAQWQYVLPAKSKKRVAHPFAAFDAMVRTIIMDMRGSKSCGPTAQVFAGDARKLNEIPDGWADFVVTSPPYPNNYDYADATRLEMSFFGEVNSWGDLQKVVRKHLIRACSQHVPERTIDLNETLAMGELEPILNPLSTVCNELAEVRLAKAGKKTYHLMVACYFLDLAQTLRSLRRTCGSGAQMCIVIGDSAPYGVYVPAPTWLGTLALAAGFKTWTFEQTRERNVKWKNRKHRVPLCEGRLWVEG